MNKSDERKKRIWVVIVIYLAIFGCCLISFYLGWKLFLSLFGGLGDAYPTITFITFEDENANGILDEGEPPLPGVECAVSYIPLDYQSLETEKSDENGEAKVSFVMNVGEARRGLYKAYVSVPTGYTLTTPSIYTVSDQRTFYFGFIRQP